MERVKREKLIVFCLSFAGFVCGVAALSMDRGPVRTAVLAGCFALLLALAVRQTLKRLNKKRTE